RLDGRGACDHRHITVEFGTDQGVVIVSFGDTKVLASSTAELTKPNPRRPSEGILNVKLTFTPMSSNHHYVGGRNFERIKELRRQLDHSIRVATIDLELLCVAPEKAAWKISMHFTVLNDDGNVSGCLGFATLASLMTLKLNQTRRLEDESIEIIPVNEACPENIRLKRHPFSIPFAMFGNNAVLDPCHIEERLKDGQLTVSISPYRELNATNLTGGLTFRFESLMEFIEQAALAAKRLHAILIASIEYYNKYFDNKNWLLFDPSDPLTERSLGRSVLPTRKLDSIVVKSEPQDPLSDNWINETKMCVKLTQFITFSSTLMRIGHHDGYSMCTLVFLFALKL
ncbi:hypothetical protein GJ496_002097, partial [Pomphorhynchus laevis]